MTHLRFSRYDPRQRARDERLEELLRLFRVLLSHAAGDAEQALEWLDRIAERHGLWTADLDRAAFEGVLRERGELERRDGGDGGLALTRKGEGLLRRDALERVFGDLARAAGGRGEHRSRVEGLGVEREPALRPWTFGDDLAQLAPTETLAEALRRQGSSDLDAWSLEERDLVVHETERKTRRATALLVDCSHSMVLYGEDRMTPARLVATALVELIRTRYPQDVLHVVAFGDDTVRVPEEQVPYLSWGPYHTNTKAALALARDLLLRSRCPDRRIFLITDGKPTVLDERGKRLIDSGYPNPRILNRTLDEAALCRRKRIPITTFMVADDPVLQRFVRDLCATNGGQAFTCAPDELGGLLLRDFLRR